MASSAHRLAFQHTFFFLKFGQKREEHIFFLFKKKIESPIAFRKGKKMEKDEEWWTLPESERNGNQKMDKYKIVSNIQISINEWIQERMEMNHSL